MLPENKVEQSDCGGSLDGGTSAREYAYVVTSAGSKNSFLTRDKINAQLLSHNSRNGAETGAKHDRHTVRNAAVNSAGIRSEERRVGKEC